MWNAVWNWGTIVVGGFIYAIGLNVFLVSNHLAEGGLVGISLLLLYKLGWPLWLTFLLFNIPLLIPGWRLFGHEFIAKTAVGVASVSLFSAITQHWQLPTSDPLLAALYAGVVTGFGLGIIFRAGATTGGADIIARLFRHLRGTEMGRSLFAIDVLVLALVARSDRPSDRHGVVGCSLCQQPRDRLCHRRRQGGRCHHGHFGSQLGRLPTPSTNSWSAAPPCSRPRAATRASTSRSSTALCRATKCCGCSTLWPPSTNMPSSWSTMYAKCSEKDSRTIRCHIRKRRRLW